MSKFSRFGRGARHRITRGLEGRAESLAERLQREEKELRAGTDEFDPYAVPNVAKKEREAAQESQLVQDYKSSLLKPGDPGFNMARMGGQERTGIFDYDYKMPYRASGVQRYDPPRGVPARTTELLARPDVREGMINGIIRGSNMTEGQDWYEAGPVFKSMVDEFGPVEGQRRFDLLMDMIASTSPRSNVGENIRNATYYYGKIVGEPGANEPPSPDFLSEKNPYPYGHYAQNLHKGNVRKTGFADSPGFSEKSNPKPLSFAWNFKGDPNLATIDTHAFRAPAMLGEDPRFLETAYGADSSKKYRGRNIQEELDRGDITMEEALRTGPMWQSKPKENEYAAWEDYYRGLGADLGMTARQAQGFGWVGHGAMTGLESAPRPFMDFVEQRILKTARERNMDPRDVWREAIRGIRPLTLDERLLEGLPGASMTG